MLIQILISKSSAQWCKSTKYACGQEYDAADTDDFKFIKILYNKTSLL